MKKSDLIRKIKKEFPDLKWKTARHNVEGWDHYAIILDDKYVFRFPRGNDKKYMPIFKKEIPMMDYLQKRLTLPVPKYTFVARDKSFAGYEMIKGLQLTKKRLDKLPKRTKKLIARQLADFLSSLHAIPLKTAKKLNVRQVDVRKSHHDTAGKTRKFIIPRVSRKDALLIEAFLKEFKSCLKFPHMVFTHADIYHAHILLAPNKKGLSGVIDFSDRAIDDPAIDFNELLEYGRKFALEVYKHYKGPKDKDFLYRCEMYYKRRMLWIMIGAFESGKLGFKKGYQMFKDVWYA